MRHFENGSPSIRLMLALLTITHNSSRVHFAWHFSLMIATLLGMQNEFRN
jgi:hypothetical protein